MTGQNITLNNLSPVLNPLSVQTEAQTVTLNSIIDNLDVSDTTRKEYSYRIIPFQNLIKEFGFHKNSLLEYKRNLQSRNDLSVSSKNKYLVVAKIYCTELHRMGLIPVDITQNVKSFHQTRLHKKEGLTDNEVTAITQFIHNLPITPYNARLKAIICLLTLQGLRQCEVIRLDVKDIDFACQRAFIQGKGRDDLEPVNLHPQTSLILKEYLYVNRIADGPLFVSGSNNSKNHRLSTRSLRNLINPIFRKLGIEKTVHGFRHFFTTKLIQSYKGDLLEIARYTRHRSLEMLQVYNDSVKAKADLPRYYEVFKGVNF